MHDEKPTDTMIVCPDCGAQFELVLYDTKQAGQILGLAPITVRYRARTNGIGIRVGRDWLFTDGDMDRLAELPGPGRPPQKEKVDDDPMPG